VKDTVLFTLAVGPQKILSKELKRCWAWLNANVRDIAARHNRQNSCTEDADVGTDINDGITCSSSSQQHW
jgi:hypothetical protein